MTSTTTAMSVKILCPACEGMSRVQSFRVEGNRLFLTCARCGAESAVEVAEPSTGTSAAQSLSAPVAFSAPRVPSPPLTSAPSSETPRVVPLRPVAVGDAVRLAAEAARSSDPFAVPDDRCPKCVGQRPADALFCPHCGLAWANFRPEQVEFPDDLRAAFLHAMEQWDEPSRHEAVLALATRTGQLPALGRLYRLRLAAAPLDPVAERGRDEVLRRASAASEVLRTLPRDTTAPKLARIAAVVLGLLALGAVAGFAFQLLRA